MKKSKAKRLFLSYAHADDAEGDFAWAVSRLEKAGLEVVYDTRVLVAGRSLWPQIEKALLDPRLDAWGWLLTPSGLRSAGCREELEYARLRMLNHRGDEFPLIGLVDRVPADQIPLAIQSRLYVDMRSPDWVDRVVAGVKGEVATRPPRDLTNCHWRIHLNVSDDPEQIAIEVRPRFGSIPYFAILAPMPGPERVGTGAAGSGYTGGIAFEFAEWNDVDVFGEKAKVHSMRGPVDPSMSAYAIFRKHVPPWVAFGPCPGPFVLPSGVERMML